LDLLVNIDVSDLDPAVRFYTTAFDLKVSRRFGADGVELSGGSAPIYLLVKAAGSAASPRTDQVRDYRRHWTPVHLDVVVQDVEAAVREPSCGCDPGKAGPIEHLGKLALMADRSATAFASFSSSAGLRRNRHAARDRSTRRKAAAGVRFNPENA
jgi:catechol 2,3-dioxygenase-like lactoylglutathione lyase family enzyme